MFRRRVCTSQDLSHSEQASLGLSQSADQRAGVPAEGTCGDSTQSSSGTQPLLVLVQWGTTRTLESGDQGQVHLIYTTFSKSPDP